MTHDFCEHGFCRKQPRPGGTVELPHSELCRRSRQGPTYLLPAAACCGWSSMLEFFIQEHPCPVSGTLVLSVLSPDGKAGLSVVTQ